MSGVHPFWPTVHRTDYAYNGKLFEWEFFHEAPISTSLCKWSLTIQHGGVRRCSGFSLSPDRTVFSCFLSCKSQCFCTSSHLPVFKHAYSHEFLLDVGRITFLELNSAHTEELRDLGLLRRPTPSPTLSTASRPQRRRYKRRERKQKRGKRGGIWARLAANPHKSAIPTIVLANVRSLDNKLDYIRLLRSTQRTVRDCCVFVFTETWLSNSVPDCAIQLDQLTCYRAYRALVEGGKRRGGGLCVYINDAWRRDTVVVCKHCSPLVEFMIIKCRLFYLPKEYTTILLVAVYIPPAPTTTTGVRH